MKNTKKLLSLVLCVAMMLSALATVPATAAAVEGYDEYETAYKFGYTNIHMYNGYGDASAENSGSGYFNPNADYLASIKAKGAFDKSKTPCVTYYLLAEEDCTVNLSPQYFMGFQSTSEKWDYKMVISVNDIDYYESSLTLNGDTNWVPGGDDVYTVKLTKGLNFVRILPTANDIKLPTKAGVWCDISALQVQQGKGVSVVKCSENTLQLWAGSADFVNKYSNVVKGGIVGGVDFGSVSYAALCTENLDKVPYFSYTVTAPYSGYYDIEVAFATGTAGEGETVGGSGVMAVMVDGVKTKLQYFDRNNSTGADNHCINGSVYIPAGTHTLTYTAALERNDATKWFDMGQLTIFGGLQDAADSEVINPLSFANNSLLWADTFANLNHTRITDEGIESTKQDDGSYNHYQGTFYGADCVAVGTPMQSYDNMVKNGLADHSVNSFDYRVLAEKAGKYKVTPYIQIGGADLTGKDYFAIISVNDKKFYRYDIDALGVYTPEIEIEVEKGVNLVRVIFTCADTIFIKHSTSGDNWINHQYLSLPTGLTGLKQGESLSLEAGQATHQAYYTVTDNGLHLGTVKAENLNYYGFGKTDFKIGDIAKSPYFAYTVTVANSGYYDISLGSSTKTGSAEGYINVFVDSTKYIKHYFHAAGDGDYSDIALSVYIPAGTHTISITNVWGYTGETSWQNGLYTDWCDYFTLKFNGGDVKKAATQVEPQKIDDPTRLETNTHAFINRFNNTSEASPDASGGIWSGGINFDHNKVEQRNELVLYFDRTNLPYVSYAVNAPADGQYDLVVGFYNHTGVTNHTVTMLVNNAYVSNNVKYNYYTSGSEPVGSTKRAIAKFKVNLTKGVNQIRILPFTGSDGTIITEGDCWINVDYLDVPEGVTAANAKTYTQFEAENATYTNKLTKASGKLTASTTSYTDIKNAGFTAENYSATASNLSKTPFVSVTVDAPVDGWYDITGNAIVGCDYPDPGYMLLIVDGSEGTKRITAAVNPCDNNAATQVTDYSVYLTAGQHVLTFTSPMPYKTNQGGYTTVEFDYFRFYNGLTVASTQADPIGDISVYKTSAVNSINALKATGDPSEVDTVIANAVAQVNSYSSSKEYEEQVADIQAIVATATTAVPAARETAFGNYKTAKATEAEGKRSIYSGGDTVATLISTAKSDIDAVTYDTSKLYTENTPVVDAIVTKLEADIKAKLDSDIDNFTRIRKPNAIKALNNMAKAGDSDAVIKLISDAVAGVEATEYDKTKSITENNAYLGSQYVNPTRTAVAAQRAADQQAAQQQLEAARTSALATVNAAGVSGDSAAITALIAATKASIEAYTYNSSISADQNVAAVNDLATALTTNLEAARLAVKEQLHVWRQYENGITSASEEAYVRFIFSLDTDTNTYTDYGLYITFNGTTTKLSLKGYALDNLGSYNAVYFDKTGNANKLAYAYIVVPAAMFGNDISVKAYFTDANGEHVGEVSTVNLASKFGLN